MFAYLVSRQRKILIESDMTLVVGISTVATEANMLDFKQRFYQSPTHPHTHARHEHTLVVKFHFENNICISSSSSSSSTWDNQFSPISRGQTTNFPRIFSLVLCMLKENHDKRRVFLTFMKNLYIYTSRNKTKRKIRLEQFNGHIEKSLCPIIMSTSFPKL